jgi:hypothetical protein
MRAPRAVLATWQETPVHNNSWFVERKGASRRETFECNAQSPTWQHVTIRFLGSFLSTVEGDAPMKHENNALTWLDQDTRGSTVVATARLYLQIQAIIGRVLPPELGAVCRVVKWESHERPPLRGPRLHIAVPSTAYAAKLRQMGPRMVQALCQAGWNLNDIAIKVHANLPEITRRAPPPTKTAIPLDDNALQAFKALSRQLKSGPLADAIAQLLVHHGAT